MGLFDLFKKKTDDNMEPIDGIPPSTWLPTPPPVYDYDRTITNVSAHAATHKKETAKPASAIVEEKSPTPSRNDNYAVAAFIAWSENGKKVEHTSTDYPRYFKDVYKVFSPQSYHRDIITDGYLAEAPPEVALKKYKIEQLKAVLLKHDLPVNGKKEDLIMRILGNVDIDSLPLDKYYIPSEKGLDHLNKYGYVLDLKKYDIKWQEFDKAQKKYSKYLKPNDVIWRILNDKFNEWNMAKCYGLARNELYNMAKLLDVENKYVDALCYYAHVLYYDTSGLHNNSCMELDCVTIAPGLIEPIHRLKDYYDPVIVDRCYDRHRLPHHYISKKNFERLLFDIFEDKPIDIKNYTA